MKIQVCSDLHLEFSENRKWFKENPIPAKGDILVIAGDTYYLNRNYAKLDFIKRVADQFEQVFLVPGNHEYYEGYDAIAALAPFQIEILENVTMMNNSAIEMEGVKLIFSTLWSSIERNIFPILNGMVDFRRIQFQSQKLTIDNYNAMHRKAFEFIESEMSYVGKKVVVSHHLPSSSCNVEEFKNSPLNEAFCVEKSDFILDNNIDYWIYGHSHRNKSDFTLGNSQMITNQFGYSMHGEHHSFDLAKVIEI